MGKLFKKSLTAYAAALALAVCSGSAGAAQQPENNDTTSLVGRIAHIEGQLLRYMPDEDDWVLTDVDTPFGEYDNLFSSEDGKAELILPNNTLLRIGGDTQVQLIALTNTVTEINLASGTARLYNRSSAAEIRVTTPFGNVIMPPGTSCDVYVNETQAEIASLQGTVAFTQPGSSTLHDVIAGSSSIIATPEKIVASAHSIPTAWDRWNEDRDAQWTKRMQARGESKEYLPESLQDHAYDLDTNGRWEQVKYEGAHRYFWRPSYVSAGWAPFSAGRWIVWRGDQTWVPCEPFGYVTHHYGNWVYVGNYWYWAPPAYAGMYWYPGRVAWVTSGISIGWFPLAPYEIYYCNRYWGPWSRVRHYHHYYDCRKYRHHRHARFIEHRHFYRAKDYRHAGLRGVHRNEKLRGSASVPKELRRKYKADNKHLFASNMPGFRDTVKKIDARTVKPGRRFADNRLNASPFKREFAKGFENKREFDAAVKNSSAGNLKNTRREQRRLEAAARNTAKPRLEIRERANRTVTAKTEIRKPADRAKLRMPQVSGNPGENRRATAAQVQKPPVFTSQKTAENRRTLQSASVPRKSAGQQTVNARPNRSGGSLSGRNTASVRQPQPGRSVDTFSASRSGTGRTGSDYARPDTTISVSRSNSGAAGAASTRPGSAFSTGQSYTGMSGSARSGYGSQRGQSGSTGSMQGFSGGGRR